MAESADSRPHGSTRSIGQVLALLRDDAQLKEARYLQKIRIEARGHDYMSEITDIRLIGVQRPSVRVSTRIRTTSTIPVPSSDEQTRLPIHSAMLHG